MAVPLQSTALPTAFTGITNAQRAAAKVRAWKVTVAAAAAVAVSPVAQAPFSVIQAHRRFSEAPLLIRLPLSSLTRNRRAIYDHRQTDKTTRPRRLKSCTGSGRRRAYKAGARHDATRVSRPTIYTGRPSEHLFPVDDAIWRLLPWHVYSQEEPSRQ